MCVRVCGWVGVWVWDGWVDGGCVCVLVCDCVLVCVCVCGCGWVDGVGWVGGLV